MIITENIKYAGHHDFVDPYEKITTNELPITMKNTRNIEFIQEPLSSQSYLELHVTPQKHIHHLFVDSVPIVQHSSHDFIDVIGKDLEHSFTQCFPRTIHHYLSSQYVEYVKFEPREIDINNETL